MRSTFFGLETARRALMAQQMGLETTAHNIANANTPGYSRQVVQIQATTPFSPPSWISPAIPGQIGTGAEVTAIQRMRDAFLDSQIRQESTSTGRWETRSGLLNQIELIYNEPSDSGLRNALDGFWESLEDLSLNPESGSARSVVIQRGEVLADLMNSTYTQLHELRQSVNDDIQSTVDEINAIAKKIASLNKQIVEASSVGDNPNDLMDQRDLLITELSNLIDVNVITDKFNATTVTVGGVPIVEWDLTRDLGVVTDPTNDNLHNVVWKNTSNQVQYQDGVLKGLMEIRDIQIVDHLQALTDISEALLTEFNAQHQAGFDLNNNPGGDFFSVDGDYPLIRVSVSEEEIAASSVLDSVGDGKNASALAEALSDRPIVDGTWSIRDYLSSTISKLGIDTQHAMRMVENQNVLVANLNSRQEAVAGVSLDEELVNMMKFQHAYNAAARLMTAFDELYDTVINRMGLAGR